MSEEPATKNIATHQQNKSVSIEMGSDNKQEEDQGSTTQRIDEQNIKNKPEIELEKSEMEGGSAGLEQVSEEKTEGESNTESEKEMKSDNGKSNTIIDNAAPDVEPDAEAQNTKVESVRPWPAKQLPVKKSLFSSGGFQLGKKGGGFSFLKKNTEESGITEKDSSTSGPVTRSPTKQATFVPSQQASKETSNTQVEATMKQDAENEQSENSSSTTQSNVTQKSEEEKRLARMQRFTQGATDQPSSALNLKGKRSLFKMKEDNSGGEGDVDNNEQGLDVVAKKAKVDVEDKNDEEKNDEENEE